MSISIPHPSRLLCCDPFPDSLVVHFVYYAHKRLSRWHRMDSDLTCSIDLMILERERRIRLIKPLLAAEVGSDRRRWLNDDTGIW